MLPVIGRRMRRHSNASCFCKDLEPGLDRPKISSKLGAVWSGQVRWSGKRWHEVRVSMSILYIQFKRLFVYIYIYTYHNAQVKRYCDIYIFIYNHTQAHTHTHTFQQFLLFADRDLQWDLPQNLLLSQRIQLYIAISLARLRWPINDGLAWKLIVRCCCCCCCCCCRCRCRCCRCCVRTTHPIVAFLGLCVREKPCSGLRC